MAPTTVGTGPVVALTGLLVLAALLPWATATGSTRAGPAGAASGPSPEEPGCWAPLPTSGVSGALTVEGGPLAANGSAPRALAYSYTLAYRATYWPNGTDAGTGCVTVRNTTTTSANGSFSFVPSTLTSNCSTVDGITVCDTYSAPMAPVTVTLASGVPAGYTLSVAGSSSPIAVALVYDLASVTIAPSGPTVTTSVGAPASFEATARSANGSTSPLAPSFGWSLNGTGWSFSGPTETVSATVISVAGAGVATVTVRASASVNGTALEPVTASVEVVAVSTVIETGEANRTVLDAGGGVDFRLTAFGAAGFAYSATLQPGLGLPIVTAPCSAGPADAGTVEVACVANVTYPSAGTAQPTASVTNGASASTWQFPEISVSPPPELEVAPTSPSGYALSPVPIGITAVNGSGAPPYARACVAPGYGPPTCSATAGPSWSFDPVYPTAGVYDAVAWAVDADGTNASVAFEVTVVPPLAVGPIAIVGPNATAGAPFQLRATLAGGALPVRFWWNTTGGFGPFWDGTAAADGPLNATVVPPDAGPLELTLTVVDRLGSVAAASVLVTVGPPTAELITPVVLPPADPVVVGTPIPLAWEAFDAAGAPDRSYAAPAELDVGVAGGVGSAWANASAVGVLAPLGDGVFGVPAAAWVGGVLNLTVTFGAAGEGQVGLAGTALPGAIAPMNLTVVPDRDHVQLFAPDVTRPGGRTNDTLWHVEDRFGDAVPGALLTVELLFGGVRSSEFVAAVALPGGGSGVWVNYTAPSDGAGAISVVDGAGDVVLGPLTVPAAAAAPSVGPTVDALATAVPLGALGVAAFLVVRRRRRAPSAAPAEEELRSLAEGRARAVELVARAGAVDLAGLEAAWDPPPAPPALADWLASLVADGTLHATLGPDGRARFCLTGREAGPPKVTVDPEALDRSLRRRDAELEDNADRPGNAA